MKAVKLLSHLLMFAFCAIMLSSCSDDDDPVRAGVSLSSEGAVLPAEASVSPASVKVNGKGGTLTIPLVCSTTNETMRLLILPRVRQIGVTLPLMGLTLCSILPKLIFVKAEARLSSCRDRLMELRCAHWL